MRTERDMGRPFRRIAAGALAAAGLLSGCASFDQLTADVTSFGQWPAGRSPGSYSFERLPSQQARADEQQQLETAAGAALAGAGFRPAAPGAEPDLLVQVGARVSRAESSPWDDPLWWPGGFGHWRASPWRGPYWGATVRLDSPRYEREVALLLRSRADGKPLYEARASVEGYQRGIGDMLRPLFVAALKDFPATEPDPHRVTVPLSTE